MTCANCGASRPRFRAEDREFCDEICHRMWKRARVNKQRSCSLRRTEPRGPFKVCEGTCQAFEACVELTRQEKAEEELLVKQRERLRKLGKSG